MADYLSQGLDGDLSTDLVAEAEAVDQRLGHAVDATGEQYGDGACFPTRTCKDSYQRRVNET